MKFLIVVDMQNDFVTGSLANPAAQAVVPFIKEKIAEYRQKGYRIVYTKDTHYDNYMETGEGKHLPVPHCIEGTFGWMIVPELRPTAEDTVICKEHFGYNKWNEVIEAGDEIVMCGTCTDICVVSNALAIKAIEGTEVKILKDGCAGLTPEKHEHALDVMASCQCEVE